MSKYATIPKDIAQVVIPTDDGWPRSVFTITTTTEDQQSKRLLVLNQESARQNYKLMAMARLFEGAQLPKFEVPTIGSRMGTDKDENLVATPADALTQYADVLQNGANSKFASGFRILTSYRNSVSWVVSIPCGLVRPVTDANPSPPPMMRRSCSTATSTPAP